MSNMVEADRRAVLVLAGEVTQMVVNAQRVYAVVAAVAARHDIELPKVDRDDLPTAFSDIPVMEGSVEMAALMAAHERGIRDAASKGLTGLDAYGHAYEFMNEQVK